MPAWNPFLTSPPRPLVLLGALGLGLGMGSLVLASTCGHYDDANTAEGWAWSQIKQGQWADFNQHCSTSPLDRKKEEDANWQSDFRKLSACFLEDLLTRAPWREAVPFAGVRITGVHIVENVDLENAKLIRPIEITRSRIEGAINLRRAHTDSLIWLDGSLMNDAFYADGLHSESDLYLRNGAIFKSEVRLSGAKIDGDVDMVGASLGGTLTAYKMKVEGDLYMHSDGQHQANFQDVDLTGAKITGQISMVGASFDGTMDANGLQVGGSPFLRHANCTHAIDMTFAHVDSNLDLRGTTVVGLDVSGASIAGDLRLGQPGYHAVSKGKTGEPGNLNLQNVHIGNLMDTKDAWPEREHLHLDGFSFIHLGGFEGETGPDMRGRGMDWGDNWARLDPVYSPAPYAQLAAASTNARDRDAADEIRYFGRVREREMETGWSYIWSGALQWVAGFGIGTYTFRVLYWVLGIAFLGALYLRTSVQGVRDENHGLIWCFGASLSRLLPVIEINEDFKDFFKNPTRAMLTGLQNFVFSAMGIVGWVLAAILVAAVSGLTRNS
jgi:hypothetical protein